MAISIQVITNEIAQATEWRALHIVEAIGEPDRLTVSALGFTEDVVETEEPDAPEDFDAEPGDEFVALSWSPVVGSLTGLVGAIYGVEPQYAYIVVRLDSVVLFSGLSRRISKSKPAKGVTRYAIDADGWQFLAPKRLVGRPVGDNYIIQEDGDPDRLPTAVAIDPDAIGAPIPASVTALWSAYWNFPAIDLTTYVTDILPFDATAPDEITWSGSDLEGATSDLAAAGSAAALWWTANDSPDGGDLLVAPHLALHFGLVVMPDDGDDGDDLLAGFPSADPLTLIAPYQIDNDNPDFVTSIMPTELSFEVDYTNRDDAAYVRGATGFTEEVIPDGGGGYFTSGVIQGGTGWVGGPGGAWGETYLDAPAAVTPDQRDAFGNAYLASRQIARVTGTIKVVGYDGWHKGQGVRVTDEDYDLNQRWFLIRSVEFLQHDSAAEANEYILTVGDTLSASLGYALRQQRLQEQRKPIEPATQFIPWVGDLLLDAGQTAPLTMQLANASGKAMAVKDVPARWYLMVNGVDLADPEDTGAAFYLSDLVLSTDEKGQITATLHAGDDATLADAAAPFAKIDLPVT